MNHNRLAVVLFTAGIAAMAVAAEPTSPKPAAAPAAPPSTPAPAPAAKPSEATVSPMVLSHSAKSIDGKPVDLSSYKGKVVLIVNTASKCGLTPQYEGLQAMYTRHKAAGLEILGFPCNDFMSQEPGTEAEIAQFCTARYSVTFPMFAKVAVKGEGTHPLYKQLIAQPAPIGGELEWNFTKFLVDREGRVVARFGPRVSPSDPQLASAVEKLLAAGAAPAPATPAPSAPAASAPAAPKP